MILNLPCLRANASHPPGGAALISVFESRQVLRAPRTTNADELDVVAFSST